MRLFGYDLRVTRQATVPAAPAQGSGGWVPVIREPFPGAWQRNQELTNDSALRNSTVYACVSRIANDIAKLRLRLVEVDTNGIWTETTSPAFSPVLRTPNRYQPSSYQFVQSWLLSKVIHGNTYVLKQRDQRGIVNALYVLNPLRVTVLVGIDGSVYYQVLRDDLAGVPALDLPVLENATPRGIVIPSSEIIHDVMVPLFHPLVGVSPLYAAAATALQNASIQANATQFFARGSYPGGLISVPTDISDANAKRMKDYWETEFSGENVGRVAVLGQGAKYEQLGINAVDSQLIDQLRWTAETICSVYQIPPFLVGIAPPPHYQSAEPMILQYYSQCLQTLITAFESCLDAGLELPATYGTEFDIDDLIYMDVEARSKAAHDAIGSGGMSPNEARKKFFALGPVEGGESPYMQQQYYSLAALSERQPPPPPAGIPAVPAAPEDLTNAADDDEDELAQLLQLMEDDANFAELKRDLRELQP